MVKNEAWLKQLLEGELTSQSFKLDEGANFSFRISDNTRLLNTTREILKSDSSIAKKFDSYLKIDDQMSSTPIWMKLEDESILSLTLKDIYQSFIKYLKNSEAEDHFFNSYEVSFLGPLGPYQYISLVECINEDLLSKFLLNQLLKNKLPARALRVRTDQVVGVTFGKEQKLRSEIKLKQITDTGLLFQTDDDFLVNNMQSGQFLKFYLDTKNFEKFCQSNFEELPSKADQLFYTREENKYFSIEEAKLVKSLGFKSSVDNSYHLFCRYNHILEDQSVKPFKDFADQLKEIFKAAA